MYHYMVYQIMVYPANMWCQPIEILIVLRYDPPEVIQIFPKGGSMFRRFAAGACFMAFFAGSAMAADVGFQVEQGVLSWSQINSETKPDVGDTVKAKEDKMVTMPDSLELALLLGKVNVYLYPTQEGYPVGVGFQAMKELEVGLMLAMNSTKVDKPKREQSSNVYGLWALYALKLGANSLEMELPIAMTSGSDKSTPAATADDPTPEETKSTTSGTIIAPSVTFVLPLNKNVSWMAGLNYTMDNSEEKVGEAKQKISKSGLGINLTTFRVNL